MSTMAEHAHHDHDHGHDDWFRHGADEAPPQHEHASHVNSTAIGLTLLAIVFGVLFTVIVLSMYFISYSTTLKAERQEGVESANPYLAYRDDAAKKLARAGWADRAAGTVYIPIESAIDGVVADYGQPGVRASAAWHGPMRRSPRADGSAALASGDPVGNE
jgi:hypothetical protein